MSIAADLLARPAHNPSFFEVSKVARVGRTPLDFCVPVNLHYPKAEMLSAAAQHLDDIMKYYPDYAETHQDRIALLTSLPAESIVVANGSTEIITELVRGAQGPLATCAPTFGQWTDLPRVHGKVVDFLMRRREDDFRLTPARVIEHVRRTGARTLVLSNPNNPTGVAMPLEDIRSIAEALRDIPLVIVDESFIDFAAVESAAGIALDQPNVVIVKSMGKALGLHGVRLGYAVAAPMTAARLRAQMPFWNINGLAAFVLDWVAARPDMLTASLRATAIDRDAMAGRLKSVSRLHVFPSDANFLFAELDQGTSGTLLRERLLTLHGIYVRDCGNKVGSSDRYLRLAVANDQAVDRLVEALTSELRA